MITIGIILASLIGFLIGLFILKAFAIIRDYDIIIKWYDLWVGFFWDREKKWLYFFPVPCCGIIIKFY